MSAQLERGAPVRAGVLNELGFRRFQNACDLVFAEVHAQQRQPPSEIGFDQRSHAREPRDATLRVDGYGHGAGLLHQRGELLAVAENERCAQSVRRTRSGHPLEQRNLAPEHPERCDRLRQRLAAWTEANRRQYERVDATREREF